MGINQTSRQQISLEAAGRQIYIVSDVVEAEFEICSPSKGGFEVKSPLGAVKEISLVKSDAPSNGSGGVGTQKERPFVEIVVAGLDPNLVPNLE